MTDDFGDLVDPLLTDPPHPAPSVDDLQARVTRRQQRRARAISACSIIAVLLVATAIVALPRSSELRAGDGGSTPSWTTAPPPPLTAGPVQLVVTPASAPLAAARTVEVRNTSPDATYLATCGFTYDLFRWDGQVWQPFSHIYLGQDPPTLADYRADLGQADCGSTPVAAGSSVRLAFSPGAASWHPSDGTTPPRTDDLEIGIYELRESDHGGPSAEQVPLGRFEVTPDGSLPGTTRPPDVPTTTPEADMPVEVRVAPERASATAERTLTVFNRGTEPFGCLQFELRRWDGEAFRPYAPLWIDFDARVIADDRVSIGDPAFDCWAPIVPPSEAHTSPLHLGTIVWGPVYGEPARPAGATLEPGWYELGGRGAGGRFEVTGPSSSSTRSPTGDATDDGPSAEPTAVDLYPGPDLQPADEVLPDELLASTTTGP